MKKITQELEERRKELGMTYKALAIKSGLMPDTVRGIMQGWQSPKIETLRILAGALEIEVKVVAKRKIRGGHEHPFIHPNRRRSKGVGNC